MVSNYIKAVPETDVDREVLEMLIERPGEQEELEEFISELADNNYETVMSTNYKGINLILERVTMIES
ncbi:MAG: hypothetical protein IKY94_05525 [Lachnospiraceae bacterium]|nr:hypothetical protein [Lachnospiraceae bacterium]